MKIFKDLYAYRELLKTNVKKEIRGKYKGSFLGVVMVVSKPIINDSCLCNCVSLFIKRSKL